MRTAKKLPATIKEASPFARKYSKVRDISVAQPGLDSRPDKIDTQDIINLFNRKTNKFKVPDAITNLVNDIQDEDFRKDYIENIYQYREAMKIGGCGLEVYLNAVRFATYITMGFTQTEAYRYTFPEKIAILRKRHLEEGIKEYSTKGTIAGRASGYAHSKMVQKLLEVSIVPDHIIYRDLHHSAIKILANVMQDTEVSPKTRVEAADSILKHTTKPDAVVQKESTISVLDKIQKMSDNLASKQLQALNQKNVTIESVAEYTITEEADAD